MSLTVACVLRSGGVFDAQWVDRLAIGVHRHLAPDAMVCLTDVEGWSGPYEFEPLVHNWSGWYSKIELFRPALFSGPVLYFDLDTLLLAQIPGLYSRLDTLPELCLLSDFYAANRAASGVMMWKPSAETARIYHDFARDPAKAMRTPFGDGGWIGQYPHHRLQAIFPGAFQSYKVQQRQRKPCTAPILCFHGKPKPHEFPPDHWVTKAWVGPNVRSEARDGGQSK